MQAPRPDKRVVQDNALKPEIDFDLECLNYHNRVFSKQQRCYLSMSEQKVWEIKKVAERFFVSHQHKKLRL